MKELVALLVFIPLVVITIRWAVTKRIGPKLTISLLGFSIASGFAIANYDVISKVNWLGLEVETAMTEIADAKYSALGEIDSEVKAHKESIELLTFNINDTRDKVEAQKKAMNELIQTATDLQSRIEGQKKEIISLNESAAKTKGDIETLNAAAAQIALILVRATYFTIETKGEFGTDRAKKAIEEVEKDLNRVLPMVISDEVERLAWVERLKNTLQPRE